MKIKSIKINVLVNFMQCSFLLFQRKNVGPVKNLQDQQMLGVTGPTGPGGHFSYDRKIRTLLTSVFYDISVS